MATPNEEAISVLNHLIETCKDGQKGFTRAVQEARDSGLKTQLTEYANQRAEFAEELQNHVIALGGNPETGGSAAGAVHRGWMDLKSAVTGRDDHAILEECERGEDEAKESYQDALNNADFPASLIPMIQRQYVKVKAAHDRIRNLRDGVAVVRGR